MTASVSMTSPGYTIMAPALKKVTAGKCLRIEMRVFVGSVPSPDAQTAGVFLVVDLSLLCDQNIIQSE